METVAVSPVSSMCYSYQILRGNDVEEDAKYLKCFIRNGINNEIKDFQISKSLSVDIVLKYLPFMTFKEYFVHFRACVKSEVVNALKELNTLKMTKGELEKAKKTINRYPRRIIPQIGSNIFQFLNNCTKFLRNQIPLQLGEGFSFPIDAELVNRLFTEETKQLIVGNISFLYEFPIRFGPKMNRGLH